MRSKSKTRQGWRRSDFEHLRFSRSFFAVSVARQCCAERRTNKLSGCPLPFMRPAVFRLGRVQSSTSKWIPEMSHVSSSESESPSLNRKRDEGPSAADRLMIGDDTAMLLQYLHFFSIYVLLALVSRHAAQCVRAGRCSTTVSQQVCLRVVAMLFHLGFHLPFAQSRLAAREALLRQRCRPLQHERAARARPAHDPPAQRARARAAPAQATLRSRGGGCALLAVSHARHLRLRCAGRALGTVSAVHRAQARLWAACRRGKAACAPLRSAHAPRLRAQPRQPRRLRALPSDLLLSSADRSRCGHLPGYRGAVARVCRGERLLCAQQA